jgi:hypothetical protein
MGQAVEDCKVMRTNSNGLAAANNQPADTDTQSTSDPDSVTFAQNSKAETTLIARLALAGHSVHPLREDGYLVFKWGYVFHALDLQELQALARRLGLSR